MVAEVTWLLSSTQLVCGSGICTLNIISLANGSSYTFKVRARNIHRNGEYSGSQTLVVPNVPSNVATPSSSLVNQDIDGRIELTWTAPDDRGSSITGYKIWRRPSYTNGLDYPVSATFTLGAVTEYIDDDNLVNGRVYRYRMKAVNAVGESAGFSPNAPNIAPEGVPTQVQDLSATNTTSGEADLTWTVLTGAEPTGGSAITDYEYSDDDGGTWTSLNTTSGSKTVTGLSRWRYL